MTEDSISLLPRNGCFFNRTIPNGSRSTRASESGPRQRRTNDSLDNSAEAEEQVRNLQPSAEYSSSFSRNIVQVILTAIVNALIWNIIGGEGWVTIVEISVGLVFVGVIAEVARRALKRIRRWLRRRSARLKTPIRMPIYT